MRGDEAASASAPQRHLGTQGVAAWRSTVIRATGGTLITTVVAVVSPLTLTLTAILAAGLTWLVLTSLIGTRSGWTQTQTRIVVLVDLLAVFLVAAVTGGTASSACFVLWLVPLAWVVLVDRRQYVALVTLVPLGYLALWLTSGDPGGSNALNGLAVFLGMYAGSVIIGLVLLHLRIQAADHAETLQDARTALLREVATVEHAEHERLSTRLHDGPLQLIISARQDLEDRDLDPHALALAVATLDDGITGLRAMVSELYPAESTGDVVTQLAAICARAEQRQKLTIDLQVEPRVGATHDDLLVTLVNELVTNAAKHARASQLQVSVLGQPGQVVIEVSDDGIGIDQHEREAAAAAGHIGLTSLDRRVRTAGGSWRIRSAPGRGTVVRIELPR